MHSKSLTTVLFTFLLAFGVNAKVKLNSCEDLDHGKYTHFESGHFAVCEENEVVCYKNLADEAFSDSPVAVVDCASIDENAAKRKLGVFMNGRPGEGKPWPKGVMCYRISGRFSAQQVGFIKKAAENINAASSTTGASVISTDQCKPNDGVCGGCRNYVAITSRQQGCFSLVGYTGQVQQLNLQPNGCFGRQEATTIHEFGHALGLYHEHSHPKREVITIQSHFRVPPSNYAVQQGAGTTAYDKESIMHYPVFDGRRRTGLCIPLPRYKNTKFCGLNERRGTNGCVEATEQHCDTGAAAQKLGNTRKLSNGDIATLKAIYNPNGETKKTAAPTTTPGSKAGSGNSGTTPQPTSTQPTATLPATTQPTATPPTATQPITTQPATETTTAPKPETEKKTTKKCSRSNRRRRLRETDH